MVSRWLRLRRVRVAVIAVAIALVTGAVGGIYAYADDSKFSSDEVTTMQLGFTRMNHGSLTVDGEMGAQTSRVFYQYAQRRCLPEQAYRSDPRYVYRDLISIVTRIQTTARKRIIAAKKTPAKGDRKGVYGDATKANVSTYQEIVKAAGKKDMAIDGIAGAQTRAEMSQEPENKGIVPGLNSACHVDETKGGACDVNKDRAPEVNPDRAGAADPNCDARESDRGFGALATGEEKCVTLAKVGWNSNAFLARDRDTGALLGADVGSVDSTKGKFCAKKLSGQGFSLRFVGGRLTAGASAQDSVRVVMKVAFDGAFTTLPDLGSAAPGQSVALEVSGTYGNTSKKITHLTLSVLGKRKSAAPAQAGPAGWTCPEMTEAQRTTRHDYGTFRVDSYCYLGDKTKGYDVVLKGTLTRIYNKTDKNKLRRCVRLTINYSSLPVGNPRYDGVKGALCEVGETKKIEWRNPPDPMGKPQKIDSPTAALSDSPYSD